jgi:hypothetical protein
MLGIPDPAIWLALLLCLASTVLCVIYGALNWNRDDDSVCESPDRERAWEKEEERLEEEL